jgi:hypothetical protein
MLIDDPEALYTVEKKVIPLDHGRAEASPVITPISFVL